METTNIAEEQLKAIQTVSDNVTKFKDQLGSKADKTDIEKMSATLTALAANVDNMKNEKTGETVKAIQTQLDEMKEDVSRAKESGRGRMSATKTFGRAVVDAIKDGNMLDTPLRKGEHRSVEVKYDMVNKASATMSTANVTPVGTNSIPFTLSEYEGGLTRIVRRTPWLLDIANVSSTSKMYVNWAEQANPDGSVTSTAEGVAKNKIDFDYVEKSKKVEKYTAYIKVSKEALDDLDGLANEIDTELREQVLLKVDADLLAGDGITPNIAGLLTMDTAFSAGSFANLVRDPKKVDALRVAIAQVVANQFSPNYIILHPDDIASMDLEKGTDGHYLLAPFKSADGMMVSGVKIIGNTGQTVDKFTVGDFTKFNVKVREGITIDMGLDGSDFTLNLVTILAEIRLVSYIKTNHAGAFVSGDFGDAITAIDSGS